MFLFLIFIFGLSVGSFINAFVYRWQNKKEIVCARSRCPNCQHELAWYDLIPLLSFIILKGRCRYCHQFISWQYPLVEFFSGLVFILPVLSVVKRWLQLSDFSVIFNFQYIYYLIFSVILIIIFAYDLRYMLIPDRISITGIIIVLIIQILNLNSPKQLLNLLLAALIASGFFFFQFVVSQGTWIGGGDIRLGFLMGLMLGWPNIILGVFLAYLLGTVVSLPLVIMGRKKMSSLVPLGVYLTTATICTLLWGESVLEWYWSLF